MIEIVNPNDARAVRNKENVLGDFCADEPADKGSTPYSRAGSPAKIYSGCAICSRPCVGSASVQGTDTPSSFRIRLQMQWPPSPWSFPPGSDDRPTVSARRRFSGSDAEGLKLKH